MGEIVRRGTKDLPRYYLRYVDADGKRKMRAAKGATTSSHARRMLAEVERRVMNGKLGIAEPTTEELARANVTVKELCEKFLTGYRSPKHKDPDRYERESRSILSVRVYPQLGHRAAAAVQPKDVEAMRDALTAGRGDDGAPSLSPRSVTMALAKLSKVYNWGRRQGHIECPNPVSGCDRPQSSPSLDYLSKAEVAQLLAALEDLAQHIGVVPVQSITLHPMVATAIYTGLRKGELFGLRWIDVHLDAGRIDVMRSYKLPPKSGKPRHLPIHPDLGRILRAWEKRCPASEDGLVFPVNGHMGDRYETMGLGEALDGAKCHTPAKPWHALRHTFASHFMMAGGNILTLQKLLGHGSVAMTMIYAHLAPDFMAGEVARMSFVMPVASVSDIGDVRRLRGLS